MYLEIENIVEARAILAEVVGLREDSLPSLRAPESRLASNFYDRQPKLHE